MNKKEYEYEKELIMMKNDYRMIQLKYIRRSEEIKHEKELERGRIKTAEIRKSQMRQHEGAFNR